MRACLCAFLCVYMCVYVCVFVCLCTYVCMCLCVCMCVCVRVCMCVQKRRQWKTMLHGNASGVESDSVETTSCVLGLQGVVLYEVFSHP